ncbi:hypothetical protein I552_0571 [Mycobacterium xenopi 3993]|nr:hypothetical protein I552_0571 [Mycobacterium xenopi 3993]
MVGKVLDAGFSFSDLAGAVGRHHAAILPYWAGRLHMVVGVARGALGVVSRNVGYTDLHLCETAIDLGPF